MGAREKDCCKDLSFLEEVKSRRRVVLLAGSVISVGTMYVLNQLGLVSAGSVGEVPIAAYKKRAHSSAAAARDGAEW